MYTPSSFRILDSANSSIDLKLKEAFYISKNKPDHSMQAGKVAKSKVIWQGEMW